MTRTKISVLFCAFLFLYQVSLYYHNSKTFAFSKKLVLVWNNFCWFVWLGEILTGWPSIGSSRPYINCSQHFANTSLQFCWFFYGCRCFCYNRCTNLSKQGQLWTDSIEAASRICQCRRFSVHERKITIS